MSQVAIRVQGVGKQYSIVPPQERRTMLREVLTHGVRDAARALASPRRSLRESRRAGRQRIWVLQDISFEVQRGDTIGILGGNGAGKSTLLKILSRITEPTVGDAWVHGRVGSLLEVGTGFHPELTGRENTFLSGAILGMRRSEITRKFDEIVAFAGVEQFIDMPVKHYSSGMYLRLAFAVAAHLEPEILIVDEVLAVGDAAFQKKCIARMMEVARDGRTVLFVSHDMTAVQNLCSQALLLENGRLVDSGQCRSVVARYLSRNADRHSAGCTIDLSDAKRTGTGEATFAAVRYASGTGETDHAVSGDPLRFELGVSVASERRVESLGVSLRSPGGPVLVHADSRTKRTSLCLRPGQNHVAVEIDELPLNPGVYVVDLWLGDSFGMPYDRIDSAFEMEVVCSPDAIQQEMEGSNGLVPCRFVISHHTPVEER